MSNERPLGDLRVSDIRDLVVQDPSTIGPDASLHQLLSAMVADLRTRTVYVVDNDRRLLGCVRMDRVIEQLFPLQAIIKASFAELLADPTHLKARGIGDLMVDPPPALQDSTPLSEVAATLMQEGTQELAVVDAQGRLLGEVNVYEIIKAYLAD